MRRPVKSSYSFLVCWQRRWVRCFLWRYCTVSLCVRLVIHYSVMLNTPPNPPPGKNWNTSGWLPQKQVTHALSYSDVWPHCLILFPLPVLSDRCSQINATGSSKASHSHYPTLSRHFSCISDRSHPVKGRRRTETVSGSLRAVSVKWEQCFLRNHRLTNEGWWSSSCRRPLYLMGPDDL